MPGGEESLGNSDLLGFGGGVAGKRRGGEEIFGGGREGASAETVHLRGRHYIVWIGFCWGE